MTYVANNPYMTSNLYYNTNERVSDLSQLSTGTKTEKENKTTTKTGDTVTLSDDVAAAKTRESMGLDPTGPLKLGDFEKAAESQQESVHSRIESALKELGISKDQKITLSLDSKSKITIKESFQGKDDLEKVLNGDKEFYDTFKSLNANSGVLNYTKDLRTSALNTNLADYLNSETDWSDIMSLASKYTELKSSSNPLATLSAFGLSQSPYSYTYSKEE